MIRITALITFSLYLTACTGYKIIHSSYDKSIDFSNYKSFAWLPINDSSNNQYDNAEFRNYFIKEFTKQIVKKHYSLNKDTPDFLLSLKISYSNKIKYERYLNSTQTKNPNIIQSSNAKTSSNLPPNDYYYSEKVSTLYNNETYVTNQINYIEDYITINLYDNKTKKLIWTVTSEADIYEGDGVPSNPNSIVKNMIRKLMEIKNVSSK